MESLDEMKIQIVNFSIEQYKLSKQIDEIERMKQELISKINHTLGIDSPLTGPKVGEYRLPS